MAKRNRRTAAELLAAAELRANNLRQRAAMDEAKSSPMLSSLLTNISDQDDILRESSKLLGNGPQSTKTRRQSHELWISEINAQENLASVSDNCARTRKKALQEGLSKFVSSLANGKKVTKSSIDALIAKVFKENTSQDVKDAEERLSWAIVDRQNATKEKRAPKRRAATG